MSQCIFCKIINKEIPGHILFENEHVLAFLDISQTTKGHTLIIPKKHVEDVFSMNEEDMTHVLKEDIRLQTGSDEQMTKLNNKVNDLRKQIVDIMNKGEIENEC